jgi:primosomal protein N' (replication factor Y)
MAGIVLSSPNVQEVFDLASANGPYGRPCATGAQVYGPAPAHRSREYAGGIVRLQVAENPATTGACGGRRSSNCAAVACMAIDIDPQSFYWVRIDLQEGQPSSR